MKKKIFSTILCILAAVCCLQFNSYADTESELLNQTNQLYTTVKVNNNNMSFNGLCGAYVYQQMKVLGLGGPSTAYANQWYGVASQMSLSSTGYRMIAKSGKNSLKEIYQEYGTNGELKYLVVTFPYQYGMSYSNPGAGHEVFIYAIKDNKVIFSESYDSSQFGKWTEEGQAASVDIDTFINVYSSMYGNVIGTVYFQDPNTIKVGWDNSQGYYRYGLSDGQYAKNQFVDLGRDQKYYFDENGRMVSNDWILVDGKWYHAAADGHMDLGWQNYNGEWYYFNDPAGDMKVNGWETFEGKRYYLTNLGPRFRDTVEYIDGKYWQFDEEGAAVELSLVKGWNQIGSIWKYILTDNTFATAQFVDLGRDQKYYFDLNANLVTNEWISYGGKWYHAAADGHMDLGWQYLDGSWYYFNDPSGDMKTNGWETYEGKLYYLGNNGARYHDTTCEIDGKTYRFNDDGVASEVKAERQEGEKPITDSEVSRTANDYQDTKQASSTSNKSTMQAVIGKNKPQQYEEYESGDLEGDERVNKKIKLLVVTGIMAGVMGITAYAGEWRQDASGWWYQNDDGTFPANTWQWIDGNDDGIAECYYFNNLGYCLLDTITPDGYVVDSNGAWRVDQTVQTKRIQGQTTKKSYYSMEEACEMALQYFNSQYSSTNGTNVIFIEETTTKGENYLFIVRWQMSDEEAERRRATGRSIAPNIYNGTVVFNRKTGEMGIEWQL